MNKLMLLAAGSLMALNAQAADQQFCGYKDFFHLSDQAHPSIYVASGYSEQDIILQIVGPRSFVLRDSSDCRRGYAHVTVAYDALNWCILDIKDGPFMNHPVISASCNGMHYLGTNYDGTGSYSYTINLD